jgi:hypothetical protein
MFLDQFLDGGPKEEPNALIATKSEVADFLRRLKLI